MGYHEVQIIADGALDDTKYVSDDLELLELIVNLWNEWPQGDPPWEVFNIWHEHGREVEDCACAQYLTTLHPIAVIGDEPRQVGQIIDEIRRELSGEEA